MRSTQPRLVTEPTTKPTLAPPRHSRTPTCTRCIGACALAPAMDAASVVKAAPARMMKRRMRNLRLKRRDASREAKTAPCPRRGLLYATTPVAVPDFGRTLFQIRTSFRGARKREPGISRFRVRFAPRNGGTRHAKKRGPLPRASFVALYFFNRDGDAGDGSVGGRRRTEPAAARGRRRRQQRSVRSDPAR